MKTKFVGKTITSILSIILLLCVGFFTTSASAQQMLSVDLVIVLDNSGSMKDRTPYSDIEGYRYDAAAIMINLCEIYNSRAAIIQFNTKPSVMSLADKRTVTMPVPINPLTSNSTMNVEGEANRSYYTNELKDLVYDATPSGNTYLGAALKKAIELLDAGESTRGVNQPMILVLADGKSSTNDDKEDMEEARLDCKKKGYKIYTVLLLNKDNTDFVSNDREKETYMELATTTGGTTFELADPSILPEKFSEIFANQIGSSLIKQSDAVKQADGSYTLAINIPNHSVMEANIILQSENLNNIDLLYPNGDEATSNSSNLFVASTDRFKMYKMVNPTTGIWTLQFFKEDDSVQNIATNILFGYSVVLEGSINSTASYGKNDPVLVTAQFYESGQPSTDNLLYSQGIKARIYLLSPGDSLPSGGLVASDFPYIEMDAQTDRFAKTITLKDFQENGVSVNQSGDYELYIYAEGDGLERTSSVIPFSVINNAPVVKSGSAVPGSIDLFIDDPLEEDINKQDEYTLDANTFISDPDLDTLTMQLTCDDDSLINLADDGQTTLIAKLQTRGTAGDTYIRINASDTESAKLSAPIVIPITITSITNTLKADYTPVITAITQLNNKGYYEKDSTFEFRITIEMTASDSTAFDIDNYQAVMTAVHVKGDNRTGMDVPITLTKESARVWTGSIKLADNMISYPIKATLSVGNNVVLEEADFVVQTDNEPPVALENPVLRDVYIEPLPLLSQEVSEPLAEDFSSFFTDSNPYDVLTFSVTGYHEDIIRADVSEDNSSMTVNFIKSGTQTLTITATDTSGESADLAYEVHVISYTQELIKILKLYGPLALLAIIILYIIRYMLKPSFSGMMFQSTCNGNDHLQRNLKATKRCLSLHHYADEAMLKVVSLGKGHLKNIKLIPGKKCIYVKQTKKPFGDVLITVDGKNFSKKKKKLKLAFGREIRIANNNNYISWQLKAAERGSGRSSRRTPPPNRGRAPQSKTGSSRR